jgi:hypothetical protein
MALPTNVRLDWKVIVSYKHSSLFGLVASNGGKKFYNIATWSQCLKNVFSLSLMQRPNKLERLFLESLV